MADGLLEGVKDWATKLVMGDGSSKEGNKILKGWRAKIIEDYKKADPSIEPKVRFNEDGTILLDFTNEDSPRAWIVAKEQTWIESRTKETWAVPIDKDFKATESSLANDLEGFKTNNYKKSTKDFGWNDDRELEGWSAASFNNELQAIRSSYDDEVAKNKAEKDKAIEATNEQLARMADRYAKLPPEKITELTEKAEKTSNLDKNILAFEKAIGVSFEPSETNTFKYYVISDCLENNLLSPAIKKELGSEFIRDFTPDKVPAKSEEPDQPFAKPGEQPSANNSNKPDSSEKPGNSIGNTIMGFAKEHPIISLIAVAVAGIFGLNFLDPSKENAGTLLGKVGHGAEVVGDVGGIAAAIAAMSMLWKEYGGTITNAVSSLASSIPATQVNGPSSPAQGKS